MTYQLQAHGPSLAKVLRNVELFHDSGVSFTQGKGYMLFTSDSLVVYGTDGWIAAKDSVDWNSGVEKDFTMGFSYTGDQLDALIQMAVAVKTQTLSFNVSPLWYELPFSWDLKKNEKDKEFVSIEEKVTKYEDRTPCPEWVDAIEEALEEAEAGNTFPQDTFALRPDRLRRFTQLRVDKDAPLDFRWIEPINKNAGPLAVVKAGHTFRGLVNFVNRDTAKARASEEDLGYYW